MTRQTARFLILSFLLGLFCPVHAASVTVGVGDQNREALGLVDGMLVGALAKLYQCPLDRSGLSFDMRLLPQARVLLQLQRGELDLGLPLVRLDHRDEYAVFTAPMMDIPFVLYTSRGIEVTDDLSAYTFTVLRSSASVDLVAQRKAQFAEVSSWTQALELARLGRFDGAVIPEVVLKDLAAENFAGLQRLDFGSLPLSMYVSRKMRNHEDLVQKLNAAVTACRGE